MEVLKIDVLDYDVVMLCYEKILEELVEVYVNVLNIIYYMYDKYVYEKLEMVLYDCDVKRLFVIGIVGLSVVVDFLLVIKYVKVYLIYDEILGLIIDFEIVGEFLCYGNDDDRVDDIVVDVLCKFMSYIRKNLIYRELYLIMSVLIIILNVVYGKNIGNILDGCCYGELFVLGVNLMYGRDKLGVLKLLMFVVKLLYEDVEDGILNIFIIILKVLGYFISVEGLIVYFVDDV